jgi:4-amino-4-deoxy-L-arabinose transferase-like glycosyltransferase
MKRQPSKNQVLRASHRSEHAINQAPSAPVGRLAGNDATLLSMPAFEWTIVVALLLCHAGLAFGSSLYKSVTYDEPIHLLAGLSYWTHNDYRLNPENGNLPQRLFAIPVALFGGYQLPPETHQWWKTSDGWALSEAFLFDMGNDFRTITMLGRSANVLLSIFLCLTVYLWSKHVFGILGGITSLALASFCPNLIAHGRLMTSDTCATLFLIASVASIWLLLQSPSIRNLLFGIVCIGGMFLSKYSAAILLPVAAVLVGISFWKTGFDRRTFRIAGCVLVITFTTWAVVWAAFGFRFSANGTSGLPPSTFFKLESVAQAARYSEGEGKVFDFLNQWRITPEAWNYGGAFVLAHAKQRSAFLAGDFSMTGWWYYFPYCVIVKTPVSLFGLIGLSVAGLHYSRTRNIPVAKNLSEVRPCNPVTRQDSETSSTSPPPIRSNALIPLVILLLFSWGVFLTSHLNIGIRHVLLTYPILYILAGFSVRFSMPRAKWRMVFLVLMALFVIESVATFPHYLGYFNQLVGSKNGWKHLVDSNLDWGQDVPALAKYCHDNNVDADVFTGYFGTARLEAYDIAHSPILPTDKSWGLAGLRPGTYCVSATFLQGPYRQFRGPWKREHEAIFAETSTYLDYFLRLSAEERQAFIDKDPSSFQHITSVFFEIQAHRLCRWLATRAEPDAMAGRSILIYRLDDRDLTEILHAALDGVSRQDLTRVQK